MIKRTTYEYDIKHTGDEMDRLEILMAFRQLADMAQEAGQADFISVDSVKCDLITVIIETVERP